MLMMLAHPCTVTAILIVAIRQGGEAHNAAPT
jgi:hypothetical protein